MKGTTQTTEWDASYLAQEITDVIRGLSNSMIDPRGDWAGSSISITQEGYNTAISRLVRLRDSIEALNEINEQKKSNPFMYAGLRNFDAHRHPNGTPSRL